MKSSISFRLPEELKSQVEQLAKRSLLSVADVTRLALRDKVKRENVLAEPEVAPIGEEPR